jgi:hypothetical protein
MEKFFSLMAKVKFNQLSTVYIARKYNLLSKCIIHVQYTVRHTGIQEFPNLNPSSKGGSYNAD